MRELARDADGLIEGFRPGVMERLGLGPGPAARRQSAPRLRPDDRLGPGGAARPGGRPRHQLYRARRQRSTPTAAPAGRRRRRSTRSAISAAAGCCSPSGCWPGSSRPGRTGKGQVIDCAMVDGAALLSALTWSLKAAGMWKDERGVNLLDTGAALLRHLRMRRRPMGRGRRARAAILRGAEGEAGPRFGAARSGPARRADARRSAAQPRDHWCDLLEGTRRLLRADPLAGRGARPSAQRARAALSPTIGGVTQPAPAPRFSAPGLPAKD